MSDYVLSDSLKSAIEIALYLNRPLLLCGEPGTGKTTLAKHLALLYRESPPEGYAPFFPTPLKFNTKTTSAATDLFYHYDALARLRDAYSHTKSKPEDYIELKALGKAIVLSHGTEAPALDNIRNIRDLRPAPPQEGTEDNTPPRQLLSPTAMSSIVLIDEIDKAPRDFPNDILNEIEDMEFEIKEMNTWVRKAANNTNILVIMTSNNERNLPDAFLRRCIFHYIEFPDDDQLKLILQTQLPIYNGESTAIDQLISLFTDLRRLPVKKRPATAEFVNWIQVLQKQQLLEYGRTKDDGQGKQRFMNSLGILFKDNTDMDLAKEAVQKYSW